MTRFPRLVARALLLAALVLCAALPTLGAQQPTAPDTMAAPAVQKTFFTRRDLAYTGVALVGTALVSRFDKRIARWALQPKVQGDSTRANVVHNLTRVNETTLTAAALLAYGVGRLTHSGTTADVALHTVEALVFTSAVSQAVRGPLGRARPSVSPDDQYSFHFGKGFTNFDYRAFPSLHSATAFAAAAALSSEIHERNPGASWYATPLLYGAAMVPPLTRVYLGQHWASDIVAGAFVGTLLGTRVVHYTHSHRRTKLDRALLGATVAPGAQGTTVLMVVREF